MLLLSSCSTQLTQQGKRVRIIASNQKQHCRFIEVITEYNEMGWNSASNQQNALNQARNRAADLGGNAIHLISNTTNSQGMVINETYTESSSATTQAEVYFCKFKKNRELKEI